MCGSINHVITWFDTLFKPIIFAYLLVYVNIVILKPRFHLGLFVLLKISDYSIVKIISRLLDNQSNR